MNLKLAFFNGEINMSLWNGAKTFELKSCAYIHSPNCYLYYYSMRNYEWRWKKDKYNASKLDMNCTMFIKNTVYVEI